jgi:hypothetical protein
MPATAPGDVDAVADPTSPESIHLFRDSLGPQGARARQ